MTDKLSNAPIYYALAQAQFNHIGAMHKYVNEVQDQLRRCGYVFFETQQSAQVQMSAPMGNVITEPQISHVTQWSFTNADRTAGFILGPSSIIYHTTHYTTKDEFLPELIRGIKSVHSVVSLGHIERLGIRYLDAVIPFNNERVAQYLVGGVQGPEYNGNKQFGLSESVFITETGPLISSGTLVSRVYLSNSALGLPSDLGPIFLEPKERFRPTGPIDHAVIDTDHYVEGRMPLRLELIELQLRNMHQTSKDVFRINVTPYALKKWA
ncbi:TIGR04255 family protein [Aeromonas veronii]|uniref:TIGR04255 family protein n=1 Tax=Aeromonas veronii TaxID=654 RepID=UPI001F22197B|nr:TIGR04255 family protein [Aeromonas veronii]MCF5855608.1 TIGR04255 family protein [Aeromonas veronii]